MKIPARLYQVMADDTDRLLDRLNEAIELDFADARDNGPARKPSPSVLQATSNAADEFERLLDTLRQAGGSRYLGARKALPNGASLTVVYERAMPLVRKITHMLRRAQPEISSAS